MEGNKLSRDSSMSAQRLTIIHYRACCCFFPLKDLLINISVLWPCVSPPLPPCPLGYRGGLPCFCQLVFGCMNRAWLPVCPLGGAADDLPVFGIHSRKVPLLQAGLTTSMSAQTIIVPTNYFAVGTPTGRGVPTRLLIAICTLTCRFCHGCPSRGGAARGPMRFYATHLKYITAFHTVCTHRKQTGISLSTPSLSLHLNVLNVPFPLKGGEVERENALQISEVYR